MSDNRDFALILAAGLSTRMGVCKTTLFWHGNQTLLRYQSEQFLQANITPIIILGSHNAHRQVDCPPGSRVLVKSECDRTKTSSILKGLESLPKDFLTLIISAVDQPRPASVYRILLETYRRELPLITAPYYRGKPGHPLLFSHRLFPDLKQISDSSLGLREIVQNRQSQIRKVEFVTPEVLIDVNNQDTYLRDLKSTLCGS